MKRSKKLKALVIMLCMIVSFTGCGSQQYEDRERTKAVTEKLVKNQKTPTDIDYSLERFNLTKRAYWVNGQRDKALSLVCQVDKPLGYIILFAGNLPVGSFVVDGKVSSLNSYLTPDTTTPNGSGAQHLADVDGTYGVNSDGIFFFTPDGKYIEWTGTYLYSDIPFELEEPVLKMIEVEGK